MTTWTFDTAHSSVGFTVRHMMVSKVHGTFNEWDGELHFDPDHPEQSELNVEIKTASIDTGMPKRDDHLRSADFFDADANPAITFKSHTVKPHGDQQYKVTGDLTMHGVTKEVTLDVEMVGPTTDPWGGTRYGISASGKLNRTDFGLNWNQALETGGVLVSEEVTLNIETQAVAQEEQQSEAA